jgi:DNA repair protein RadC
MVETDGLEYHVTRLVREHVHDAPPRVNGPDELHDLLCPYFDGADREYFYGVYLSTKNHVVAIELVSVGSLSASLVHPREVYKPALLHSAAAIAVAHNHPSGDPEPSAEDIEFTKRLNHAGNLLGIKLLDHIILGTDDYVSLKERGNF